MYAHVIQPLISIVPVTNPSSLSGDNWPVLMVFVAIGTCLALGRFIHYRSRKYLWQVISGSILIAAIGIYLATGSDVVLWTGVSISLGIGFPAFIYTPCHRISDRSKKQVLISACTLTVLALVVAALRIGDLSLMFGCFALAAWVAWVSQSYLLADN